MTEKQIIVQNKVNDFTQLIAGNGYIKASFEDVIKALNAYIEEKDELIKALTPAPEESKEIVESK